MHLASKAALLGAALIWGSAFSAQKLGAGFIGPLSFNASRFTLGFLSLLPLLAFRGSFGSVRTMARKDLKGLLLGGLLCGLAIAGGANLQQFAILESGAGKSAFITGLYIVFVPLAGWIFGKRPALSAMAGVVLALAGMAFLTLGPDLSLSPSDLLLLLSVAFWTAHIMLVEYFSARYDVLVLSFLQFVSCAVASWVIAIPLESPGFGQIQAAFPAIAYTGIVSVGMGYTLQVIGQKGVPSGQASLILSMEAVAGAVVGFLVWGEGYTEPQLLGCLLMVAGMVLAQMDGLIPARKSRTVTAPPVMKAEGVVSGTE